MSIDEKELLNGINISGFRLEFETKKILTASMNNKFKNIEVELNKSIKLKNNSVKYIDLFVKCTDEHGGVVFIIECKGSNPENALVLIKAGDVENKEYKRFIKGRASDNNRALSTEDLNHSIVYTGDFFNNKNGVYVRMSKNDAQNNLYKGLQQINEACRIIFSGESYNIGGMNTGHCKVVPILVTNAKLYTVNYNDCLDGEISNEPYVLCANFGLPDNEKKMFDFAYIVNISSLEEFINKISVGEL